MIARRANPKHILELETKELLSGPRWFNKSKEELNKLLSNFL